MTGETSEPDNVDIPDEGDDEGSRVEELEKEIQYAKAEIANIRQRAARENTDH